MPGGNSPRVILYDSSGDNPLVGSTALSSSIPVVLANDHPVIGVSGTIFTQPVPGVTGSITGSVGLSGPVAVSNFPASQSVTQGTSPWVISGSNWIPTVTGSVGLSGPITGTVGLAGPVAVSNFPATQVVSASNWIPTVTGSVVVVNRVDVTGSNWIPQVTGSVRVTNIVDVTGSNWIQTITGSMVVTNQVNVTGSNWIPTITGSVKLTEPVTVLAHNITAVSGSVAGLLVGGQPVSAANPVPITGSVSLNGVLAVSGGLEVTQGSPPWIISGSNWIPVIAGVFGTGSLYKTVQVDASGNLITTTPGTAAGSVAGFSYGTVATTAVTNIPVRNTTYTEQTASFTRSIASANAADSSAGTGAQQVTITYYSYDFSGPFTEVISLSGTTGNPTLNSNICFIEKMAVSRVGSGGVTAGIISLYQSPGKLGTVIGSIAAGDNQTFWAHHYVPSGKTTYLTSFTGNNNNSSNQTTYSLQAQASGSTAPLTVLSDTWVGGGGVSQTERAFGTPVQFSGPGRIILYGAPGGTPNITNRGSFDYYER